MRRSKVAILALNIPSSNQCLHSFNALRFDLLVKMIIESSSHKTKFSTRSICFKIRGNWLLIFHGSGDLWWRTDCARASIDGRSAAIFNGALCKTLCKITLIAFSRNKFRYLISFWIRMTWSRFGFAAWQWHDGSWRNISIFTFVWQRSDSNLKSNVKWNKSIVKTYSCSHGFHIERVVFH